MSKLIAFWKCDTFPYCLWGEVITLDTQHFIVKGYDGMKFSNDSKIVVMAEHQAILFINLFEGLMADKRRIDTEYHNQAMCLLKDLQDVE